MSFCSISLLCDSAESTDRYSQKMQMNQNVGFSTDRNHRIQFGYEDETNFPMVVSRSRHWGLFVLQMRNFPFQPQQGPRSVSPQVKFINPHKGHTCKWPFAHSLLPRVMQSPVDSRLLPSLVTENTSPPSLHGEEPLKDTDKSLAISSQ